MTRGALLALTLSFLMSVAAFAGDEAPRACCAARSRSAASEKGKSSGLRCSLMGKVVSECCCVRREGKLHCTLADKDVERCCCKPVSAKAGKPATPKA